METLVFVPFLGILFYSDVTQDESCIKSYDEVFVPFLGILFYSAEDPDEVHYFDTESFRPLSGDPFLFTTGMRCAMIWATMRGFRPLSGDPFLFAILKMNDIVGGYGEFSSPFWGSFFIRAKILGR